MENLNFYISGSHDDSGNVIINLDCEDIVSIKIKYNDPYIAQYIISNLTAILSNMLDDYLENMLDIDMDAELRKILEEGEK